MSVVNYNIRHILAPVDLSDTSLNAVELAGVIARATGAVISLLYVTEFLGFEKDLAMPGAYSNRSSQEVLPALAASLQTRYGVQVALLLQDGNVTENILREARSGAADLIVMGKHGASGFRDGFAGHNTYYTIKYGTVPVLVVPFTTPHALFSHLVYPFRLVNGSQMRHDLVLPLLETGATVELLSVAPKLMDVGNRALHAFSDQVRERCSGKNVMVQIAQGTSVRIGKELAHYASRNTSALLVINNALDMDGKSQFIGPHTQTVINGSKNPLLFVPLLWEQATMGNNLQGSRLDAY